MSYGDRWIYTRPGESIRQLALLLSLTVLMIIAIGAPLAPFAVKGWSHDLALKALTAPSLLLAGLLWQFRLGYRRRVEHALTYISRFNDPGMLSVKQAAEMMWRRHSLREWEDVFDETKSKGMKAKDVEGLYAVYSYLNFLEELALAYRRGYVDRVVVRNYFVGVYHDAWASYNRFIALYDNRRPNSFAQLKRMVAELEQEEANR